MPVNRQNIRAVPHVPQAVNERIRPAQIHAVGPLDTNKMLSRYQTYVQYELAAQQCFWLATYKGEYGRENWQHEKMHGWQIMAFATPAGCDADFVKAQSDAYLATVRERGPDFLAEFALAHAGSSRVHSLADIREERANSEDWIDEHLMNQEVGERIVGVCNLSPIAESYILVGRKEGEPPFDASDAERLRTLILDFPRVHHWLMLERGLVAPAKKPFSPREQEVVRGLLGNEDEGAIADRLGISQGTAHNYIVDIFRNFGVTSRLEMNQLWLQDLEFDD